MNSTSYPKGEAFIYSSTKPFNEEMEIDFKRLWEWLTFFHIEPCGFTITVNPNGDYEPIVDKHYHASGHASGEDVTWVIDQIDPDVIIPIHTQARDWFTERYENVLLVDEGERYEL